MRPGSTLQHNDAFEQRRRTVGRLRMLPKVCSSATTSEATRLSQTQLMMMLITAKVASILHSQPRPVKQATVERCVEVAESDEDSTQAMLIGLWFLS